jgi:hypothetical protein
MRRILPYSPYQRSVFGGILFLLALWGISQQANAQHKRFRVGSAIPVQYAAGLSYEWSNNWAVGFDAGYITYPYEQIIFRILKTTRIDTDLYDLLDQSYEKGSVATLRLQRKSDWGYWGVLAQKITLRAKDAPASVYETYFDVDFNQFPIRGFRLNAPTSLKLTSRIYQIGLFGAKEWRLSWLDEGWFWRLEAALTANIGSQNRLESPDRVLGSFSNDVDQELKDTYHRYAFIPTVGIYLVYRW